MSVPSREQTVPTSSRQPPYIDSLTLKLLNDQQRAGRNSETEVMTKAWHQCPRKGRQFHLFMQRTGNGNSSVVERRTRDRKVTCSSPGRSGGRMFFSRADAYFGIHSTPVLLQRYAKDPGHSAKGAGDRLQLKHTCTLRM